MELYKETALAKIPACIEYVRDVLKQARLTQRYIFLSNSVNYSTVYYHSRSPIVLITIASVNVPALIP